MRRERIGRTLMLGAGLVHLLPAGAVVSRERVEGLYGVTVPDDDLELLLRHRALLFGVLGVALVAGAVLPRVRVAALGAALMSTVGWIALAAQTGPTSPELDRVTRVDVVLVAALALATVLLRRKTGQPSAATMPAR